MKQAIVTPGGPYAIVAMRMDALTKEQLVVYEYLQVITIVKLFLIYVRWDQVWGTGGHGRTRETKNA